MNNENKKENIESWDIVTKIILGITILVIIFSFLSPLIFTSNTIFDRLDFTETGQIGDTIGGIVNPFIALAGVLLTFLAFYMQIKANKIQISQFNISLGKEKEIRVLNEKKDCYNKLKLLCTDLKTIESDIYQKADGIKSYYEEVNKNPYATNFIKQSPTKKYSRILEIDRLSIFNGFNTFFTSEDEWIKDFSNLYNILDFLPEFFNDIYNKYDYHTKELYDKKMGIRNSLIELMDDLSKIINAYLKENNKDNYLSFPVSKLANDTILKYYRVIEESLDSERNVIKETDFKKIEEEVLKYFLKEIFKLRNNKDSEDVRLEPIIERISSLRKQLHLIIQGSHEFANNMKSQYEALMIDDKGVSYNSTIVNIREKLDKTLSEVIIEE